MLDLLEIARTYQPSVTSLPHLLLGLAAALRPALVAPGASLRGWLQSLRTASSISRVRSLENVIDAIESFSNTGIALRPEDFYGIATREERTAEIARVSEEARDWLQVAPRRGLLYGGAAMLWKQLVQPGGDLYELINPVAENRVDLIESVAARLHEWRPADQIGQRVDRLWRERSPRGGTPPRLVGSGRQQFLRYIEEACQLASEWHNLAARDLQLKEKGDWWREQMGDLRSTLIERIPEVLAELRELAVSRQPAAVLASARCLEEALRQLASMLNLPGVPEWEASPPASIPGASENLALALAWRLHRLPEIDRDDSGQPASEAMPAIANALRATVASGRSLADAIDGWIERQDYRFIGNLLVELGDSEQRRELAERAREQERGARAALGQQRDVVRDEIEQALVDGVITDAQRSTFDAAVEAIDTEHVQDFGPSHGQLREVLDRLKAARAQLLGEQQVLWDDLREQLAQSHLTAEHLNRISARVERGFATQDVHLVDEYLAQVRRELDGETPSDIWDEARPQRDVLGEFGSLSPGIREWLKGERRLEEAQRAARNSQNLPWAPFSQLNKARRTEVVDALDAWHVLKRYPLGHHRHLEAIVKVLRYLGFTPDSDQPVEKINHWAHTSAALFRVSVSASGLARPIPQFGSRTREYTVVCLWERPGPEAIGARLRELQLKAEHAIVFYLGALTPTQRLHLMRLTREQKLGIAVLDLTLLLFLARERDARLPVFLRVSLPYATVNPYSPAGEVPSEMFFGRDEMARDLQQPNGACLVYGGRQLGKSALLRHAQRQFDQPTLDRYAWIIDLKRVYLQASREGTKALWHELRREFEARQLLRSRAEKPEAIMRDIAEVFVQHPELRVLALCDEADQFLDDDAKDGFRQVVLLRDLMSRTDRRFKVVFAGLHDVQRFQGIPNQPLAHYGVPLCVGPLEPRDAQALIREPLEVLGFRFRNPATILRILAYTNYHPGLIQHFCRELLKHLRQRRDPEPPFMIDHTDVEAVYRKFEVRDMIRQRFELTIRLDPRYEAISLAVAVEQLGSLDGFGSAYRADEIRTLVRSYWPQGFRQLGGDAFRGLLREMCGLGVLTRSADGRYGLRSPNVARLLGSRDEIENRLLELIDRPIMPKPFDHNSQHAELDDAFTDYSPLTIAQERELNPVRFGVGLVFASNALGLKRLPAVLGRFVPASTGASGSIPEAIRESKEFDSQLRTFRNQHQRSRRLVVWYRVPLLPSGAIAGLVQVALDFCNRQKSRDSWMRIIFLFDSLSTSAWLAQADNVRAPLEDAVDAVVAPPRWNAIGLQNRLERSQKVPSDDVCQHLLAATGGWPILLDEVFHRSGHSDDPRTAAEQIAGELRKPGSPLQTHFREQLGLTDDPAALPVLQFLIQDRSAVPADLVTPELLDIPALTKDDCRRAVDFLERLRCLDLVDGQITVEPTIRTVLEAG